MKYLSFSLKSILFFGLSAAFLYGCKKEFDAPPAPQDPNLTATHTIAQLKAMHTVGGALDVINDEMIISGVVIANDKSGNLYKQIYIQDASGAIQLMLDASGLFNSYPIGRRIFIKCKGLCLSDYGGMIQLGVKTTVAGSPSVQAIASNLIGQYIVGGSLNNKVDTTVITSLSQLIDNNMQDPLLGTLIRLNDFEFADTTKTYSDTSAYKETVNLPIKNCGGQMINIRTSGYANFAGVKVPSGNGSLLAIYTVYMLTSRDKKQLILRDTSDVKLAGLLCNTRPTSLMNIADLRSQFTGTATTAPNGKRISGIVISDRSTNNINARSLVLQQGNGLSGIVVRFAADHAYNLGDSINVIVSGVELSEFNGLLQVNNVPLANASIVGSGKSIIPRETTIADINVNFETWESTLVNVKNVSLSGGATPGQYAGDVTVTASGSIILRTSSASTFANQSYPSSVSSLTAYISQFNTTKQIAIRNPSTDIVAGSGNPVNPTTLMNISDLRSLFTGTVTSAPNGKRISGIVISDRSKNNLNARNLVLQQGNGLSGIAVRFEANHSFNLGDSIDVVVSGVELSEFNSLLQVNNVPLANASLKSSGKSIMPRETTIADIITNFEAWESTLVNVKNVSLSGGTTPGQYAGDVTVTASGSIILRTSSASTFANQSYPSSVSSLTAYVSQFNTTKQIAIRDPAIDVAP